MRAMHGMKAFVQPDDSMPSIQEIYDSLTSRANDTLRTAGMILSVVAVLWILGGLAVFVVLALFGRYYLKHHRIPGTLVRYQGAGDWVIVALADGTEIAAHSTLADLPEGAEVVVAIRKHGAYIVAPPIRNRKPIEDEFVVEAIEA